MIAKTKHFAQAKDGKCISSDHLLDEICGKCWYTLWRKFYVMVKP